MTNFENVILGSMVAHKCTPLQNTVRHRQGAAAVERKAATVERKAAAVVRKAAAIERKAAAIVRRAAAIDQSGRCRSERNLVMYRHSS